MSDQAVLREYLVALGFKVDALARSKFNQGLSQMDKTAGTLGKTILGVTGAAATMTTIFSREMEKLYYASRRIKSSVGNIQALEFGGGQIGLGADKMRGALEAMARSLRANPGLTALLNQLGVKVEGRDRADVLTDFVAQLKKMPAYVAEQYAALFGIDADTLFSLTDDLDKLREAQALRKKMAAEANIDLDAAAEAGVKFSNTLKEIWERMGLLGARISTELLPGMQRFASFVNSNLEGLNRWLGRHKSLGDALTSPFKEESSRRTGAPKSWFEWFFTHRTDPKQPGEVSGPPGAAGSTGGGKKTPAELFGALESKYALPAGLLGRMWKKESAEGTQMVSPKGALGHFQFMPRTAQEYGVTDPYDLEQSADGAARKMADLRRKYGGDTQMALAAYNWGQGNLDRYGLGRAPAETRDYVSSISGTPIQQNNNFYINGAGDPQQVADRVLQNQRQVNADLTRNMTPRVQ